MALVRDLLDRFKKRVFPHVIILSIAAFATSSNAHDFWLQPESWQVAAAQPISVTLQVGHGQSRQRSPIKPTRVTRFEAVTREGHRIDLKPDLHLGGKVEDALVHLSAPGTYVLGFETDNAAESHLPAEKFNEYLAFEGITPALELRARTGRTASDGAENYSRHAKTVVQVGPRDLFALAALEKPMGLVLEIVPLADPHFISAGKAMPVRVYYRGSPLVGALVKLTDLDHDAQPVDQQRTNTDGRAIFVMPNAGNWQFNVIWTRPQDGSSLNDFDTSFSSLTFGINK